MSVKYARNKKDKVYLIIIIKDSNNNNNNKSSIKDIAFCQKLKNYSFDICFVF